MDQAREADPEILEETEMIMKMNKARMGTSAEAVGGAEEEQEVQETQAGQETKEDPVAPEARTEAEGEIRRARFNIKWPFAWKG